MRFLKRHPILIGILVLILAVRAIAPSLILKKVNGTLAEISPFYSAHVKDLDISILRMAYRLEGLTASKKGEKAPFFTSKAIDVSVAWRELFRGRVLTDIDVVKADLDFDKGFALFVKKNPEQSQKDAVNAKDTLFPVKVERLRILDSEVKFRPLDTMKDQKAWRMSDLELAARNITPTRANELTLFTGSGRLMDNAPLKIAGEAYMKKEPVSWKVDAELHGFDVKALNPIMREYIPLTFNRGDLDVYAEVRSENGKMLGYVKPFAKDLDFVGDKGDFKGVPQFFVEVLGAFAKEILKNKDDKSVATQIDFGTVNGQLKVNTGKAIGKALDHGFGDSSLDRKIDNSLELKTPKVAKEDKK